MRLADIFLSDRRLDETNTNIHTNSSTTASVNRQIKAMVPGQTIKGEIVSKNGGEVQIKLSDDMVMNAKLEQNMNLEIGKLMTFEVRNNGKLLTLSPLFANTATDANVLKALDMASLPVNETTVEMAGLMMKAGLSIDKNSLQQMYREVNSYPEAPVEDIVDLHRLGMPVNNENVEQIASYKNLTHQIMNGMEDVMSKLDSTVINMVASGDIEGAAKLLSDIISVTNDMEGISGEALPTNSDSAPDVKVIVDEALNVVKEENAQTLAGMASGKESSAAASALSLIQEINNENQMGDLSGVGNVDNADNANALKTMVNLTDTETVKTLNEVLKEISGKEIPANISNDTLVRIVNSVIKDAIAEHDTEGIKKLLNNAELKNLVKENLQKDWTIDPKDVADARKVEDLYHRLNRQLRGLSEALENAGQTSQGAYKAVAAMSQNIDFLQQLNQMYAYVQLPLKLTQGNANGDLYVYTNGKKLSAKDGKVSALLHLDMEHLGPVDVYVALENSNVSTKFYVQDDDMLDFLNNHMDILTQRLEKRGYNCTFEMKVRDGLGESEGGVKTLLKQENQVPFAQYAFDVRA